MVDEEDDWSVDAVATLDAIIADSRSKHSDVPKKVKNPLESEALALIAAVELTYPWIYREADQAKLDAGDTTISAIAVQHEVPPHVIEYGLSQEPCLRDLRQEAYQQLGLAAE